MRLSPGKRSFRFLFALVSFLILGACAQAPSEGSTTAASGRPADSAIAVTPGPGQAPMNAELAICSDLSLKDVIWPLALDYTGRRALALGLNISGSFEGPDGWKNITNNFDGQGVSLGLLNQCLGQGSLQPLLVKMRDRYPSLMKDEFSSAHLTSLLGMLTKWQGTAKVEDVVAISGDGGGDEALRPDGRLSELDSLPPGYEGRGDQESTSGDSVVWAKQKLYTNGGTTFVSAWKNELQSMSANPFYVSIQIEAALTIHSRALAYMKSLDLRELRAYLFLFDTDVQNGGLYSSDIAAYKAAFPTGSTADETTRLKKILTIRLTHVIDKYRSDVSTRKLSIINGSGVVHGTERNYPNQFCFSGTEKIM